MSYSNISVMLCIIKNIVFTAGSKVALEEMNSSLEKCDPILSNNNYTTANKAARADMKKIFAMNDCFE